MVFIYSAHTFTPSLWDIVDLFVLDSWHDDSRFNFAHLKTSADAAALFL